MKRSTWILLVAFLALAALAFYLSRQDSKTENLEVTPVATVEFVVNDSDGVPSSFSIEDTSGNRVALERNESGVWVLLLPIETEADQGSAEAAASQLSSLRILSRTEVDPADAGLVQPAYTLTFKLTGGTGKVVRIGDITPSESGYYVIVNGSPEVAILSRESLTALLSLLENPPYLATPTPESDPPGTPEADSY